MMSTLTTVMTPAVIITTSRSSRFTNTAASGVTTIAGAMSVAEVRGSITRRTDHTPMALTKQENMFPSRTP